MWCSHTVLLTLHSLPETSFYLFRERSNFHVIDIFSRADHTLCMLTLLSVCQWSTTTRVQSLFESNQRLEKKKEKKKKKKKWWLKPLCYNHHYKIWIKGKWSNPGKGVAPSPALRCSNYWKWNPRVALDYGRATHTYTINRMNIRK